MEKILHSLDQGSADWHDFRANHFGASEAAAMLGLSKYQTRTELLTAKKTGIAPEVSEFTQSLFDKGHATEAAARAILEERLDEDLYPTVYSKGKLSASVDGIDLAETFGFEHKLFNQSLFDSIKAGVLPDEYQPQCQQVLYVTGANAVYFVCSDGTEENFAMVRVEPDADWIARIIQGWAQFERDLADFVPVTHAEKPVAEVIKALPALAIAIKGEVSLSNLPAFQQAAEAYVAAIKTDLETDQDFVDAAASVKFLDEAEKTLEHAKKNALGQTASIDELLKTIDHIKDSMRVKRLALDKLVKSEKERIKASEIALRSAGLANHLSVINCGISPVVISVNANFFGVIKGISTIKSLHDKLDTELSRCKIEADSLAAGVRKNLALFDKQAPTQKALFADLATLALQPFETFSAIVENRLAAELARVAQIEIEAKVRAEAAALAAVATQAAPAVPPIVLTPKAVSVPIAPPVTPKYADKPTPTLREIASLVAFDYAVDAKTATAWIINAVNHYQNQSEAA
ncbi:MAG: YqaJ viral recombinase family protein [Polynucleobacter sp.]